MKKSIALFTSTLALTSSLISADDNMMFEPKPPHMLLKGGVWQLFGFNEEIDLKETFSGYNIKAVWTWDNFEADGTNAPWKAYSTEFSMRKAFEENNMPIVDRVPPNQGFWVMSFNDVDIEVVPFNPIKIDMMNIPESFKVEEGQSVDGSIKIFSKTGDEIKVDIKNGSDLFTVTPASADYFTSDTESGVDYQFSIDGQESGQDSFVLQVTDIVNNANGINDHNYTFDINIDVEVNPVPSDNNNNTDDNQTEDNSSTSDSNTSDS